MGEIALPAWRDRRENMLLFFAMGDPPQELRRLALEMQFRRWRCFLLHQHLQVLIASPGDRTTMILAVVFWGRETECSGDECIAMPQWSR
jgi:hypothetical protein